MSDAAPQDPSDTPSRRTLSPGAKLAVEAGPLVVFFLSNSFSKKFLEDPADSIFVGTGAFMLAFIVALLASWIVERRIPPMTAFTGVFVLIFGGLTIILQDDFFVKFKPTLVNLLLAGLLTAGLLTGRSFLKVVLGEAIRLQDEGWRILTVRWIWFFVFLAVLNEFVWRTFSADTWVAFKLFGIMPITILFSLLQLPLMQRYQVEEPEDAAPETP